MWDSLTLALITDISQENNLCAQKVTSQVSAIHVVSTIDACSWMAMLSYRKRLYIKQSYTKYADHTYKHIAMRGIPGPGFDSMSPANSSRSSNTINLNADTTGGSSFPLCRGTCISLDDGCFKGLLQTVCSFRTGAHPSHLSINAPR